MNKLKLLLGMAIAAIAISATVVEPIEWKEGVIFDFGTLIKDAKNEHTFEFTNNSDNTLVISAVKTTCGCTVAKYTKDPIPAGQKGEITATVTPKSAGVISKTVKVYTNFDTDPIVLTLKGEVK